MTLPRFPFANGIALSRPGDRGFESISLQRGVCCELGRLIRRYWTLFVVPILGEGEEYGDLPRPVLYRLRDVAVLDSEPARERDRLASEDRLRAFWADQRIQRGNVLAARAGFILTCHDDPDV